MNLESNVVLITGGSRGIGKAIAMEFAKRGANIAICDIDLEGAQNTAKEVEEHKVRCVAYQADVSRLEEAQDVVSKVMEEFGKIDVLINNAGITRDNLLVRMKVKDWELVLDVNLKGVFNFTKAVARPMMKARFGRIINVSSVVGIQGNAGQSNYSASKAGIIGFTKSTAQELASRNITVNAVAPGFIETEMTQQLPEDVIEEYLKRTPLGRAGTPEDVANVIAFLASDEASFVTGEVIRIDGGMAM